MSSCLLLETENPAAFLALAQSVSIWGCARAAGPRVAGGQAPRDGTVQLGRADWLRGPRDPRTGRRGEQQG